MGSSLVHCITVADLHPVEAQSLKDAAKAYREEGFTAQEANKGAVKDIIKTLEAERRDILGQVKKQIPEYFEKLKEIKKPEPEIVPEIEEKIPKEPVVPIWEKGRRPSDKDILSARKIVQAEKTERKKIIKEIGFPQGRAYGLIEKMAGTPTTKEIKAEKSKEPVLREPEEEVAPIDIDDNELVDMDDIPVEINPDGTITLYHRTTAEKAENLKKTGKFRSLENTNETFFSNKFEGQAVGYGEAVITVKVKPSKTRLDDAFHGGEVTVAVSNKFLSKANIVEVEPRAAKAPPEVPEIKEMPEVPKIPEVPKEVIKPVSEVPEIEKESLAEIKSRLIANIKSEKGSSELINDLSRLGADAMRRGHTTYKAFTAEMKTELGNVWEKIKSLIRKAFFRAKQVLKTERGAVEIGKPKPKPEIEHERTTKVLKTATREVKDIWDGIKEMADEYLGSISTRLANIDPSLKAHLRSFEYKAGTTKGKRIRQVQPFLEKIKGMSKKDKATFDLARKNADAKTLQRLIIKYNLSKEYKATRFLLNKMYAEAEGVGYKLGYRKHFHPRAIKDPKGFLEYLMDKADWPLMNEAIRAREVQLGRYLEEDEKAQVINSLLRGFGRDKIMLSIPGQLKAREIKTIWSELNKFYMDSDAALLRYISAVTDAIEARKVFGVKRKEKKATSGTLENDINDTIGHYVLDLLAKKKIRPDQEHILRKIYQARFNEVGTRGIVGLYKNLSYVDTMGSPISAITQIGDLAWALYRAGIPKTFGATWKAVVGKSALKKEDLGIERIAQEFADTSKMARAVTKVFKVIGLEKIDNIGKEALINAALKKVQDRAKNPKKLNVLWKELEPIFGQETDALVDDLKNDRISENIKLYLFNTLLDFQPVALSEMPQKYLEGGNGRIFYMLKTFTLKQFDIYRREIFQQIGKSGTRLKGLKNLITLAACFVAANASADIIKSLILNRPIDPDDLTIDNLLRLLGISKFVTWKARQEGVGSAMVRQVAPPFKLMDALSKDIMRAGDEKGLEAISSIPVLGKLYYWWFGRGAEKSERRRKKLEPKKKPVGLKKGRLTGGFSGGRLDSKLK